MRLFGFASIILFILGLICLAVPTTIAGASWPLWDTAGALAAALELFLGPVSGWAVTRRPTA
jgi:membrane-bound ClpP family serine protease